MKLPKTKVLWLPRRGLLLGVQPASIPPGPLGQSVTLKLRSFLFLHLGPFERPVIREHFYILIDGAPVRPPDSAQPHRENPGSPIQCRLWVTFGR